jgi:hypothetical protein
LRCRSRRPQPDRATQAPISEFAKRTASNYAPGLSAVLEIDAQVDAYPGPTRDLLRLMIETMYRQLVESDMRTILRILLADGARFPAITAFYHEAAIMKGRALLGRIVARGIARGEFREGAYADLPFVMIAPLLMAAIWKINFERHEPIDVRRFAAVHLDLLFEGVLNR